jgi:hypothetical protein
MKDENNKKDDEIRILKARIKELEKSETRHKLAEEELWKSYRQWETTFDAMEEGWNIESILDLNDRSIGIVEGDIFGIELKELVTRFELQCIFFENHGLDSLFLRVVE